MRYFLWYFLFLTTPLAQATDLIVGQTAPVIEATSLAGQRVQISGKVTIINFWATWCEPCRAEMPAIQSYFDKHKDQGLQVLAISMDEPRDAEKAQRMAAPFGFTFVMRQDVNYKSLGRIWRMPSTFVIDKHGVLQKNGHVGDAAVTEASLEALVTPLLKK